MYKPPEKHISDIESLDVEKITPDALLKLYDDIVWMLQTDSYRYYYLDRLEKLEQQVLELLGE